MDQESSNKFFTFGHQVLLVQMDAHISAIFNDLERDNISGLLLIKELSEDIGSLGMGLAPLLSFSIEELKTKDTLSQLVHN